MYIYIYIYIHIYIYINIYIYIYIYVYTAQKLQQSYSLVMLNLTDSITDYHSLYFTLLHITH